VKHEVDEALADEFDGPERRAHEADHMTRIRAYSREARPVATVVGSAARRIEGG